MLAISFPVQGTEQFDLSLLENKGNATVDATWFNKGNDLLPGEYELKVIINDNPLANSKITVGEYKGKVQPLFTAIQLSTWGIKFKHNADKLANLPLNIYIPLGKVDVDQGEQTITITVPQQNYSCSTEDDVASVDEWSDGINAAFTNYSLQYEQAHTKASSDELSVYGTLENGINVGGFQLRNNGYLTNNGQQALSYLSSNFYIRHDIDTLRSTALVGDFNTSGFYFSSLPLRGVSLTSNQDMFSEEEKIYIPAIVGIASSNAIITIRQNGYVIATRKVTPGPYSIKDIPATSGAGDLQIIVRESNGNEHVYYQPYNNNEMLVPASVLKYALYMGKVRNSFADSTSLFESDIQYGFSNNVTLLGGMMYAENYANASAGIGVNARYLGALYGIMNFSQNSLAKDAIRRAEKFKLGINRELGQANTYLSASYEQQTSANYAELTDAASSSFNHSETGFRQKASVQLEQMIDHGNLIFTLSHQNNWNGSETTDVRGSVNYDFTRFTLISSIDTQRRSDGCNDRTFSVAVSIPLGREKNHYLSVIHTGSQQYESEQVALTGSLLQQHELSYGVNMLSTGGEQEIDSSLNYLSEFGYWSGDFQTSSQGQRLTLGMQGSAILHHHGLTLGQKLGSAAALVHTDHVPELSVDNAQNVHTDSQGNALISDIVAYHHNEEMLLNNSKNKNIEIQDEILSATPRDGAIVELDFSAHPQKKQFIRVLDKQGNVIPFGNALYSANGNMVGIISGSGVAHINVDKNMWPLHYNKNNQRILCSLVKKNENFIWDVVCELH
ncbi:fimbria/pilus outer membrane usher protein [Serratia sp. AKBS12]|uniref:fimbria/pilus outer membrane usher protein n=1 Tax=Serratia sp. AKBS12 TaxID=2974597 RepID=UPI002166B59B|nr:fimbria/pilus outer membrane usher protein [Serratia sp. AKBS12]MCS3406122.1 fimbria/pilus outer membrane usher protein [Serratia sp. AKBS12]